MHILHMHPIRVLASEERNGSPLQHSKMFQHVFWLAVMSLAAAQIAFELKTMSGLKHAVYVHGRYAGESSRLTSFERAAAGNHALL